MKGREEISVRLGTCGDTGDNVPDMSESPHRKNKFRKTPSRGVSTTNSNSKKNPAEINGGARAPLDPPTGI